MGHFESSDVSDAVSFKLIGPDGEVKQETTSNSELERKIKLVRSLLEILGIDHVRK